MRSTLAIYITLFAIAVVAIAQIIYFKLVLARADVTGDDTPDTGWRCEPVQPSVGVEAEDMEPAAVDEPVLVGA